MNIWHQWLGLAGTLCILGSYLLLQFGRLSPRDLSYSVLNGVGAAFLVVSLLFDFNLSALIVESFWALISGLGIFRWQRHRAAATARVPGSAPAAVAEERR